jgi:murein DD-endopeptidase MepM/ murein hydrolase activator NlpD
MIEIKNIGVVLLLSVLFTACTTNKEISFINPIHKKYHPEIRFGYGYKVHPVMIHKRRFYPGIDVVADSSALIQTVESGVVDTIKHSYGGYGNSILIRHNDTLQTRYAHLKEIHVKTGERVNKGDGIGIMGNTGASTGPHLYYEVIIRGEKVNPKKYWVVE